MTTLTLFGFVSAMFLLALSPGLGVFVTVSRALALGFRHTVPMIAGIVLGDLIFLLFTIYGLSLVAETFHALFVLIRYLGAAYLIWLGIRLWRSQPETFHPNTVGSASAIYGFLSGLSVTLGNPKVILFYLGFLPTFLDLGTLSAKAVLLVAVLVTVVLGSTLLLYAYFAAKSRAYFTKEHTLKTMHRTAGSIMLGAGLLLLFKKV